MVTRNRFSSSSRLNTLSPLTHTSAWLHRILAWPSLLLGLSAWLNQHPLRTKEAGTPPIGNLMHVPLRTTSCRTSGAKSLLPPQQVGSFWPRRGLSPPLLEKCGSFRYEAGPVESVRLACVCVFLVPQHRLFHLVLLENISPPLSTLKLM